MSQRHTATAHALTTGAGPPPRHAGVRGERRRVSERSATREAIADRIVAQHGIDRDRAVASADLFMRRLRRSRTLAGY